jgi:hypothetical protein
MVTVSVKDDLRQATDAERLQSVFVLESAELALNERHVPAYRYTYRGIRSAPMA